MFGESCSFGYTEHRKIEFAIFGFFYDFKSTLQLQLKHNKGEDSFCPEAPGKICGFTTRPLVCTKHPGIN
jgi:hypothetical protein